jgi:hypothetical protein
MTVLTDEGGYAPALVDLSKVFLANTFTGTYAVVATATVGGVPVSAVFNMKNIKLGEACDFGGSAVTLVNSNQILVTGYSITQRGTYSVIALNPAPGGGVSNEATFVVTAGPGDSVPTIRPQNPLSPASVKAGSAAFNLTVFRDLFSVAFFQPDAWVNFGTVKLNRIVGDNDLNSITVSVPAFLVGSPGTVPITITNPGTDGSTGGTSTRVFFSVTP